MDFIESHQKTGKGLATEITEKLEKDGLKFRFAGAKAMIMDPICLENTMASKLTSILLMSQQDLFHVQLTL